MVPNRARSGFVREFSRCDPVAQTGPQVQRSRRLKQETREKGSLIGEAQSFDAS